MHLTTNMFKDLASAERAVEAHAEANRLLRAANERLHEDRDYWRDRALCAENLDDAP